MSVETAQTSTAWHDDQRLKATTYKQKTKHVDPPKEYGCAGPCTTPPPPVPGQSLEMFRPVPNERRCDVNDGVPIDFGTPRFSSPSPPYWLAIAAAAAVYLAITILGPKYTGR